MGKTIEDAIVYVQEFCKQTVKYTEEIDRLREIIQSLHNELFPYRRDKFISWCVSAQNNRLPSQFKTKRELALAIANEPLKEEFKETIEYKTACANFDEGDFVFGHTHYDECRNGFYFRRS